MLNNKEINILSYFLNHKNQYIKSTEIGEVLNISDRTVRKYIKLLNESLENNGALVLSKQGHGYILDIKHQVEFENFIKSNVPQVSIKQDMNDSEVRQYYMLNRLIFEVKSYFVDDLAEELFVSRSTVTHDISEMRQKLIKYSLDIESKTNKGIYIVGEEKNIRHFIMDYFLGKGFISTINKYFENTIVLNNINLEELTIIVLEETRQENVYLSDYTLQNLVLHLGLAIKRIQDGNKLKPLKNRENFKAQELKIANSIIDRISKIYNIIIPKEEENYIALHIMSKGQINNKQDNVDHLQRNVIKILRKIDADCGYKFADDVDLRNGIITHLKPLLVRLENDIYLENPLLDDIKSKYSMQFELTKKYFSLLPEIKDKNINDSEWAYLSLHILAAIEKNKERNKLNVLIICATGYGSAQMLKVRIQNEFKEKIRVSNVISYYEIDDYNLNKIDCIISTIDLSNQVFKTPVIHVSVLLNEKDIIEIKSFIDQFDFNNRHISKKLDHKIKEEHFDKFFSEDTFIVNYHEQNKEALYDVMIDRLVDKEDIHFKDAFTRQLKYREELGSIVFSELVAVPHPVQPVGDHSNIVVLISKEKINFETSDNVKIMFMLSPSKYGDSSLKEMINILVNIIDSEKLTKDLLSIDTFSKFKKLILENF